MRETEIKKHLSLNLVLDISDYICLLSNFPWKDVRGKE